MERRARLQRTTFFSTSTPWQFKHSRAFGHTAAMSHDQQLDQTLSTHKSSWQGFNFWELLECFQEAGHYVPTSVTTCQHPSRCGICINYIKYIFQKGTTTTWHPAIQPSHLASRKSALPTASSRMGVTIDRSWPLLETLELETVPPRRHDIKAKISKKIQKWL